MIDAIVSHHLNPFRSGAARFNQVLAERLGVPCVGVLDPRVDGFARPLLSLKVAELGADEVAVVTRILDAERPFGLYLHDYTDTDLERAIVARADPMYCGNDEIRARIEALAPAARTLWAPGLISDTRRFAPVDITVFSFGMAHKIQVAMFARLRELLEATGRSYALYMSNANHETTRLEDSESVFAEMRAIFGDALYFTGNLADVSVYNQLLDSTFYAAFFPRGVRANNTSVASALEHGAAVITNLDEHSPPYLRHLDNVIDVNRCEALPLDEKELARIRERARETARGQSWEALTRAIEADFAARAPVP